MKKKTTVFRIDEQVFFTMVGLCVFSLIILGFRYIGSETCYPISIKLPSDTVLVGSRVNFKAETKGGHQYMWDFRDGTVKEDETPTISHTFKTAGKYTISVTVNGKCSEYSTLVVVRPVIKVSPIAVPMFAGPDKVNLNEPVSFEDTSGLGTSWEWQFEAGGQGGPTTKKATHTFITPGRHLVTVILNGRSDMFVSRFVDVIDNTPQDEQTAKTRRNERRRAEVVEVQTNPSVAPITEQDPVPPPEPEPIKKAPAIDRAGIENMLKDVARSKITAEAFSEYLCGKLDQQVTYNGKVMTFRNMCVEIERVRDRRVRRISVVPTQNETTGCIESMHVTLTRTIL